MVDVDWYVEADQSKYELRGGPGEGGACNGVSSAAGGATPADGRATARTSACCTCPSEKEDVPIVLRLDRASRSSVDGLQRLKVRGSQGSWCRSANLSSVREAVEDKSIYHKNLSRWST